MVGKVKTLKVAEFKAVTGIAASDLEDGQWHKVRGFIKKTGKGIVIKEFAAEICDQAKGEGEPAEDDEQPE